MARRGIFAFSAGFLLLLLTASCTTGRQPVTASDLENFLPVAEPIAVVYPLVTVYREEPGGYETSRDQSLEVKAAPVVSAATLDLLRQDGWSADHSLPVDWRGLAAGRKLQTADQQAGDPVSSRAALALQQLENLGERLRVHEKVEGIPHAELAIPAGNLQSLAPEAESLLFTVVIGCFGLVREGPCLTIQYPLPPSRSDTETFFHGLTVPAGLALRLYWVELRSGRLLWYDDFSRFNLNPSSGKDLKLLVEKGLAEFPHHP